MSARLCHEFEARCFLSGLSLFFTFRILLRLDRAVFQMVVLSHTRAVGLQFWPLAISD